MPTTDTKIKLHVHHVASDTPAVPVTTNRHVEFSDDRNVRSGVIMQLGGTEIILSGLEFFNMLREAKSYASDWGSGDRPSRADIREAIRQLKATGGYAVDRRQ